MSDEDKLEEGNPPVEPAGKGRGETPAAQLAPLDQPAPLRRGGKRFAGLFVIVSITAIASAMLLMGLCRARATARHMACRSNLKSISYSVGMYMTDYDDFQPPAGQISWHAYPGGWQANWPTGANNSVHALPLQTLATCGYLNVGWRDNRDRIPDSVCRCPSDRAAARPIRDPGSFNACKYAHCAGGLTVSYAFNHVMHDNPLGEYREWSKSMHNPAWTMLYAEYDWWNHPHRLAFSEGIHPDSLSPGGGLFSYRFQNNLHCPTDRHGGKVNILFCDMHVGTMDPLKWNESWAFSQYDNNRQMAPRDSKPVTFYWPLGHEP
ncbi:MAG: Got1/Sft2-like family vesicle transport protein [Planctomycetota bacterium]|jgi:prepilin-type processing-associated H-X9-DG protein